MPAQTRIIHFYVCLGAAGGKECEVIMEKNLEIEYKMLLTEEVFHQLMNDFTGHTYSQTNYYLTSIELGALRYSLRIISQTRKNFKSSGKNIFVR